MLKKIIDKIKGLLFSKKNKLLTEDSNNENILDEKNEFEEYNINYKIEDDISKLIEDNRLDKLSIEQLKIYIEYFKDKADFYTQKCNFVDEKIEEFINANS